MSILLVELDPNEVSVDEALFPNKEKNSFVYEHLRHYCSKIYPLPTITLKLINEIAFVVRGHYYLSIARELGHQQIRAVIDSSSPCEYIQTFLHKNFVTQLNWEVEKRANSNELVGYVWYVLFFAKSLNQEEKDFFEAQVVSFFREIKLPDLPEPPKQKITDLNYPYAGKCAEFQAYLPITDERWYASSRAALIGFHSKSVPIVSFQGRKFQVT